MASPFAPYANATLTFPVNNGSSVLNDDGNVVQGTTNVTMEVILKLHNNSRNTTLTYAAEIQKYAGTDSEALLLSGFLVDPMVWPPEVPNLGEGAITMRTSLATAVSGVIQNRVESGLFKLLPVYQTPYVSALKIDLITPIIGIWRTHGVVR